MSNEFIKRTKKNDIDQKFLDNNFLKKNYKFSAMLIAIENNSEDLIMMFLYNKFPITSIHLLNLLKTNTELFYKVLKKIRFNKRVRLLKKILNKLKSENVKINTDYIFYIKSILNMYHKQYGTLLVTHNKLKINEPGINKMIYKYCH